MPHVTIVIPCYNEGERISLYEYERFLSARPFNLLFVNDGSKDKTLTILENLREQFPYQVDILSLQENKGKANAVRMGILQAVRSGRNDLVGFMDADLSTPLEETEYFVEVFRRNQIEFVFGSRIAKIGSRIKRFPYRHYLGRIIASVISIYLKIPVYDSQCGAKFFRPGLAIEVFREPFTSKWLFDVEIFKRIEVSGRIIEACSLELPLNTWIEKGQSKLRLRDFLFLPLDFAKIVTYYWKEKGLRSSASPYLEPFRNKLMIKKP